ncbi:FAD-dependent monooxygenase, partial [Mycobacterium sp. UM_3]
MNAQPHGAPAALPDFVPVIIIGAGPTGITAATLLGQYGCLLYTSPSPR